MPPTSYVAIGEFSRQVGVSVDLLRAWERRYGLPRPTRTPNGRRLYSRADERAVRAMRRALAQGLPAADAARVAAGGAPEPANGHPEGELDAIAGRLRDALTRFDDARAQDELDRLFGTYSVDTAIATVVLPYLDELGERWAGEEIGVAHEHFASNLIHGRLLSLARKWDEGHGPRALLACPQGERHTLGLLCFGLTLRMRGWRITYLGADTPIDEIARVAATVDPVTVVIASVDEDVYRREQAALAELAGRTGLAIGGAGATPELAERLGAGLLASDPVTEAAALAFG